MKEVQCPNCQITMNVSDTAKDVVCNKCLEEHSKSFIMVESPDVKVSYNNLGGGFFEKKD